MIGDTMQGNLLESLAVESLSWDFGQIDGQRVLNTCRMLATDRLVSTNLSNHSLALGWRSVFLLTSRVVVLMQTPQ